MPKVVRRKTKGLAERVVEIRNDFGISQEEFGRRIGMQQSAIAKYEKGYPMPKVVAIAIGATYGVNVAWLEQGDGRKYVKPDDLSLTTRDLELLHFLKQQHSLYDLIRFHLNTVRRTTQGGG
jgi:transcriptional regulator with XRE-family HTH domain